MKRTTIQVSEETKTLMTQLADKWGYRKNRHMGRVIEKSVLIAYLLEYPDKYESMKDKLKENP